MGRDKQPSAACKYYKKKCQLECPFAPIFPSDKGGEDFQYVIKVFCKSNFRKLIKSAGTEQCLADKTLMIMEARGRMSDGLPGIAETLSSELAAVPSPLLEEDGSS
ncbi:hypothetical protein MKX03_002962, partial [Papaver bracteatum]